MANCETHPSSLTPTSSRQFLLRCAKALLQLLLGGLISSFADGPKVGEKQPQLVRILARSLLPQGSVGKEYSFQFRAAGDAARGTEWQLFSPVPKQGEWEGWTMQPDGRLSGKLSGFDCSTERCPDNWICGSAKRCEGVIGFYVSASRPDGQFEQRLFELVVTDPANPLEVGTSDALPAGAVGQQYETQFYARGGVAPFVWKTSSGSLPPGLTLDGEGTLAGIPAASGSFRWSAEVKDSASRTATKKLSLRVDDLSTPIAFTPNPKEVVRPTTPRIGLNVSDDVIYYKDDKLANQYLLNPGLEPAPATRKMYLAWAGSSNTLEEHYLAQFLAASELDTGVWNGGHYWILSGPAKGREGTIFKYERVSDKTVEGGYRAVWTLADSDPSRVIQRTATAADLDKNIFMVEALPQNARDPKSFQGTWPDNWMPLIGDGSTVERTTFSVDKRNAGGGTQSAKVVSTQDGTVGWGSNIVWNNPWRRLRSDTTYSYSVDVRQSGVADRKVTVQLAQPYWTQYLHWKRDFDVPDDGKFHHLTGNFVGNGTGAAGLQILIKNKGTLWIDNAVLWESSSTTTVPNGPRQPPVVSAAFEPLPFVLDDLKKFKVGCLRFSYHGTYLPLRSALNAASATAPGPQHNIFSNLKLAELTGSNAWIVAAKEWLPEEFAQLAEYLSSKDLNKGMGKLRAEQGHPLPWTDTIGRIYIEYVDEAWNYPQFGYPFDPWHPQKYASFAKERFNAFRKSKYYSAKVTLIANGQYSDDYWVNDPIDKLTYPAHDAMDIAPYVDTFTSVPLNELAATVLGEDIDFTKVMLTTMRIWSSRGEKTKMLIYEGGPGTLNHSPAAGDEVRKNSMTLTSLSIDSIADLFAHGADEYNLYVYQNNAAWQVTTGASSRFRLPIWYAARMFNSACGGKTQVGLDVPKEMPTLQTLLPDGSKLTNRGEVAALSVRVYIKEGKKSFLAINRSPNVHYPVLLQTVDAGVTYRVTTLAASRGDRGTLEGLGLLAGASERDLNRIVEAVQPSSKDVNSADGGVRINLPPAAVMTIEQVPAP